MSFNEYISSDKNKWGKRKGLMALPQYKFVYLKRKCEYWRSRNKLIFIFWRLIYQHYETKYLMDVPAKTVIGKGFKIEHLGGVIINSNAQLGGNVTILNNVLIGMEKRGKRAGCPIIGNKVYIASGAVITGKVKIGNNVLIVANSFVNFDIPDNSIVIGNKIVKSDTATEYYI